MNNPELYVLYFLLYTIGFITGRITRGHITKKKVSDYITKKKDIVIKPKLGAVKRPTQKQILLKRDPVLSDTYSEMSKLLSSLFKNDSKN